MMPTSQSTPRRRKLSYKKLRGMTLVELMVTVTVAGVLATAASVSFDEQIKKSRSVEAVSMLGTMQKAVSIAGIDTVARDSDLNFTRTTFGKGTGKDGGIDGDGNSGHGNNDDGCDPDNPGAKCGGDDTSDGDDSSKGKKDGGIDGDGNSGHGNNDDGCDPDNPGAKCGGDDTSDGDDSSSDGSGDGSGDGSSTDGSGDGSGDGSSTDGGGDDSGSSSGSDDDSSSGSGTSGTAGGSTDGIESLCGSADPVPSSIEQVRGKVYNAGAGEWSSGSDSSGWSCLKVSRSGNQSYQFGYDKGPGTLAGAEEGYTAWARGDLDGDGRTSLFRVSGNLVGGKVINGVGVQVIDGTE